MQLRAELFPPVLLWAGNGLALCGLLWTSGRVPWRRLSQPQLTGWLGASTLIAVLWQFAASIKPGLSFHLLGASALTLIAGRDKALLGMAAVVLASCANGSGDWLAAGWSWLLGGVPPVLLAATLLPLSRRHLPPNYFSYFFANAFFGAALSFCAAALSLLLFHLLSGSYTLAYLLAEALPYYLLFSWSEAFTTGMVMAVLVIYRPQWVESFDDSAYLQS
ncbi:energy-coupling factor ABC transporter permease [Chitinimonas sp.]|uniref:energy-coupling factor ABC transporter permease n=1 Tax=Chitinimonas sp. TaxID=1934313 RepID=UPI002F94170C